MHLNRRGLLIGLGSLIAAPAIVRVSSLMPVKVFKAGWEYVVEGVDQYGLPVIERISLPARPIGPINAMSYALEHISENVKKVYKNYTSFDGQRQQWIGPFDGERVSEILINHVRPKMTVQELESSGISVRDGFRKLTIIN